MVYICSLDRVQWLHCASAARNHRKSLEHRGRSGKEPAAAAGGVPTATTHQRQQHAAAHRRSGTYERMDRAGNGRADFAGTGLAAVATAMSYLLPTLCGRSDPGGTPLDPFATWQVILALGLMSAGLLLVMYGVRAPGARPPVLVRRAADAAGALLWYAAGPERLLPLTLLLLLSYLEAWFDFF